MDGKKTISVAVATYNEEENLRSCLDSVKGWVSEIVVVDGDSRDKTAEIAGQYGARVIITDNPPIFHINKQKALDACRSDWILQLDADEVITEELREEILETINSKQESMNGYYIPRRNFFWGHFMKKGGQYPDYVIRLIRNGKAKFPCKSVHEQIEVSGQTGYLTCPMLHYTNKTRDDYWKKADTYTTLTAGELARRSTPKNVVSLFTYTVWKPLVTFFLIFARHKGFVDGVWGFEFALYSGLHWAIAYKKYLNL